MLQIFQRSCFNIATTRSRKLLLKLQNRNSSVGAPRTIIQPKPQKTFLGITRLVLVFIPFCYVGGMISKAGADLLEDYDIFVPEDDDDD